MIGTRIASPSPRGLLAAFAILVVAAAAQARPPHLGRGEGPLLDRFLERHADALGLDEATRARVEEVLASSAERHDALRDELEAAHESLRTLLDRDEPDRAAVMAQADVVGSAETALRKHRLGTMLALLALLTPEQRAAMREMRDEARGWRHDLDDLRRACGDDAERLCRDVHRGPARFMCLREHEDELGGACREALESLPPPPHGEPR
jgi:Spy/CpxP family protein refolding chaperone